MVSALKCMQHCNRKMQNICTLSLKRLQSIYKFVVLNRNDSSCFDSCCFLGFVASLSEMKWMLNTMMVIKSSKIFLMFKKRFVASCIPHSHYLWFSVSFRNGNVSLKNEMSCFTRSFWLIYGQRIHIDGSLRCCKKRYILCGKVFFLC